MGFMVGFQCRGRLSGLGYGIGSRSDFGVRVEFRDGGLVSVFGIDVGFWDMV